MLLSSYHPQHWSDIWRIDIDIWDKPGVALKVVAALERKGIKILCGESSAISNGQVHRLCYICSLIDYVSDTDRDTQYRSDRSRCAVPELFVSLFLELQEDLIISEGKDPALKIRRIRTYHEVAKIIREQSAGEPDATVSIMNKDVFTVPTALFSEVMKAQHGGYQTRAVVSCDSYDRVIHILFSPEDALHLNCRVYFPSSHGNVSKVYEALSEAGFNILRGQLREGAIRFDGVEYTPDRHMTLTLFLSQSGPKFSEGQSAYHQAHEALSSCGIGNEGEDWGLTPSHLY